MILEGIVTTLSAAGELNVAPMGPLVERRPDDGFVLRPFQTATTYQNLTQHPEGVLHVVDDALLLARAAIGRLDPLPETFPAQAVTGQVIANACRWLEFRIASVDDSQQRSTIECEVVHVGEIRPHWGFNRARHAVLEAAILATRVHLLPAAEILAEFDRFGVIVGKTGGADEHTALDLLREHVEAHANRSQ